MENLSKFSSSIQLPSFDKEKQEHAFMMFPIVIKKDVGFTKDELVQFLEEWNIETRDMLPLINQPVYEYMNIDQKEYPVADWINNYGFYISCHQGLTQDNLQYITNVFDKFFSSKS